MKSIGKAARWGVWAGGLLLCVFLVSVLAAQSGKAVAQELQINADTSRGVLAVTANLVDGEILSIEVMGPGSKLVVDEDVASSSFTWTPGAGDPDGIYRYEIQAVNKATGNTISRKAGTFTIRGGELKAPREIGPPRKDNRQGMLHDVGIQLARAFQGINTFLFPVAEAADLTAQSTFPAIFFDDTNDEDCSDDWDWLIWTSGGTSNDDAGNFFVIYGRGENATGNCENAVQIVRLNHDGKAAPDSSRDSLVIDSDGDLHFAEDRMFFDRSASRLGIGTITPQYTLDAVGDRIRLRSSTATDAKTIQMRTDGSWIDLQAGGDSDLLISTTAARNIYLSSNRVGVGTSIPLYKFSVSGGNSNRSTLHFTNTGTDVGGWLTSVADNNFFVSSGAMWDTAAGGWVQKSPDELAVMAGSGPSGYRVMTRTGCAVSDVCPVATRMMIDYGGNVGFGIAPAHPLHMASGAHVTVGGVWTDASSRQYKDHIRELALEDALKTIRNLNPVTFSYKADPAEKHVGFIAEDVPDLVAAKDRNGLSPMDIVAVMTKVVQEQQGMIEKQQEIIEKLNARLEDLERRLR